MLYLKHSDSSLIKESLILEWQVYSNDSNIFQTLLSIFNTNKCFNKLIKFLNSI